MKENSQEWLEKEQELKGLALALFAKLEGLKREFANRHAEVVKYMLKYPMDVVDAMDWEEKQKVIGEADLIFEQLKDSENKLKQLDSEYECLRGEVNTFYGREVMHRIDFDKNTIQGVDENDPADWWKH